MPPHPHRHCAVEPVPAAQPATIALGADAVASTSQHYAAVGVPIEVVRAETAKIFVEDTSATTFARTLG